MTYPRTKVFCVVCKKLRFSTLLWKTTKAGRARCAATYICSDCTDRATPEQRLAQKKAEDLSDSP